MNFPRSERLPVNPTQQQQEAGEINPASWKFTDDLYKLLGDLSALNTTAKNTIVAAINELAARPTGGGAQREMMFSVSATHFVWKYVDEPLSAWRPQFALSELGIGDGGGIPGDQPIGIARLRSFTPYTDSNTFTIRNASGTETSVQRIHSVEVRSDNPATFTRAYINPGSITHAAGTSTVTISNETLISGDVVYIDADVAIYGGGGGGSTPGGEVEEGADPVFTNDGTFAI